MRRPGGEGDGLADCIVCGVDDSAEAREAAGVAAALSAALGSRLVLAHVVPLTGGSAFRPASWTRPAALHGPFRERAEREAEALLAEVAGDAGREESVERLATVGDPAQGLAEIAAAMSASMVVVGSRGRGGMRSAVRGSVSSRLTASAPCPVVVVAPGTGVVLAGSARARRDDAPVRIDVTRAIHPEMELYPGDPPVRIDRALTIAAGDAANVTHLDMGAHTGTHVDAPVHFLEDGGGVESLRLDALVGPAEVVDARRLGDEIDAAALDALDVPDGVRRLILATAPGAALGPDAARRIVERNIVLVGVDQLSVGGPETHAVLLGAGVVILEGLDLCAAPAGRHRLTCLPLLLPGADGAPARAILEGLP